MTNKVQTNDSIQ